jgi:toxin-antitoxin system PIN domain toxin
VIVPDVNLLLYATIAAFAEHRPARRWFEQVMNSDTEVGLAAPALFGFVRITSNPRVFAPAMSVEDALAHAQRWLERPRVRFLMPGPKHLEIAFRLLRELGTAANLTTDVQLAAHAIEYQAELCSADQDFGRFAGLRWTNPLGHG